MKKNLYTIIIILMGVFFCSCEADEPKQEAKLNLTKVKCYSSDETLLTVENSKGNIEWKIENPLVATIEPSGNSCVVTGKYVGKTNVKANNLICEIEVAPKYTNFKEPYLKFNNTPSQVHSYMSWATLEEDSKTQKIYHDKAKNILYAYSFENNKLTQSTFMMLITDASYAVDYLLERYIPVTQSSSSTYGCINPEQNMLIVIDISNYLLVTYKEYTPSKSNDVVSILNEMHENIKNLNF